MILQQVLSLFASVSFLYYGYVCLFEHSMVEEFKRFGMDSQRKLTGILQLVGGIGLLAGFLSNFLGLLASGGLCLLMLAGFGVRLKISDSFLKTLPSFFYMILTGYLAFSFFQIIRGQ